MMDEDAAQDMGSQDVDLTQLLDRIADMMAQRDVLKFQKQDAIEKAVPEECRKILSDMDAEFDAQAESLETNMEELTKLVRDLTKLRGATCTGSRLKAVYVSGRTSWDTRRLERLAQHHPEIEECRKVGEPSVRIVAVGGHEKSGE